MVIQLFNKIYKKYDRSIRFLLVGIYNTLFGYVLFCILDTIISHMVEKRITAYMLASVMSTIISILNAYIFHKKITFKSKINGISGIIMEFLKFSCTYSFTFIIGIITLPILVEIFKFNPKIAAAIITLFCTVISYVGHLNFTFRNNS